jgi:ABC-2 type transport system ATP-binding protein
VRLNRLKLTNFRLHADTLIEFESGLTGIIGPNGSGKTTTLRMIMNILLPDRGTIRVLGRSGTAAAHDDVGYLPEERGLYRKMQVDRLLHYYGALKGARRADIEREIRFWLERLDLVAWRDKKIETLSKGMSQKVQLIATVIARPKVVILDEPFSGLDPIGVATMTEVLRDRVAAGTAVVFSSHQLDLVEDICEDVVIIAKGRIVAAGELDALKHAARRRHLEVEVDGADGSWLEGLGRADVLERRGNRYRLLVDDTIDLGAVLERASAAGTVRRFVFSPPALSELFMEAVQADPGAPAAPGGTR